LVVSSKRKILQAYKKHLRLLRERHKIVEGSLHERVTFWRRLRRLSLWLRSFQSLVVSSKLYSLQLIMAHSAAQRIFDDVFTVVNDLSEVQERTDLYFVCRTSDDANMIAVIDAEMLQTQQTVNISASSVVPRLYNCYDVFRQNSRVFSVLFM